MPDRYRGGRHGAGRPHVTVGNQEGKDSMDEKPKGLKGQPRSVKALVAAVRCRSSSRCALIPGVSEVVHEAGGQDALVAAAATIAALVGAVLHR